VGITYKTGVYEGINMLDPNQTRNWSLYIWPAGKKFSLKAVVFQATYPDEHLAKEAAKEWLKKNQ